jgi:hypothetical protein
MPPFIIAPHRAKVRLSIPLQHRGGEILLSYLTTGVIDSISKFTASIDGTYSNLLPASLTPVEILCTGGAYYVPYSCLLISNKFCNGGERPEQGEQVPLCTLLLRPPQYGP